MIENLLIGSGGTLGFYFLGILKLLNERNLINGIKNILGVSVGSLLGLMLALKFTYKEIYEFSVKLDLSKILNIKQNKFLDITSNLGFDNAKSFIRIIKIVIKHKTNNSDITFEELYRFGNKNLIIPGTNITLAKSVFFSKDTYPNMKVWEAVTISCSIPMVFQPYRFENHLYLDGAVDQTFITYFKVKYKTLNLIVENISDEIKDITTFSEFMKSLIFYNNRNKRKQNFDIRNTIDFKASNEINPIDFDMNIETKKRIYNLGYEESKKRIDTILQNLKDIEEESILEEKKKAADKISIKKLTYENLSLRNELENLKKLLDKNDKKNKENNINDVYGNINDVDGNINDVDDNINDVDDNINDVNDNINDVNDNINDVDDNINDTNSENISIDIKK